MPLKPLPAAQADSDYQHPHPRVPATWSGVALRAWVSEPENAVPRTTGEVLATVAADFDQVAEIAAGIEGLRDFEADARPEERGAEFLARAEAQIASLDAIAGLKDRALGRIATEWVSINAATSQALTPKGDDPFSRAAIDAVLRHLTSASRADAELFILRAASGERTRTLATAVRLLEQDPELLGFAPGEARELIEIATRAVAPEQHRARHALEELRGQVERLGRDFVSRYRLQGDEIRRYEELRALERRRASARERTNKALATARRLADA